MLFFLNIFFAKMTQFFLTHMCHKDKVNIIKISSSGYYSYNMSITTMIFKSGTVFFPHSKTEIRL